MSSATPLRAALRDPVRPGDERRMWSAIDRRWRRRSSRPNRAIFALVAALLAGALAVFTVRRTPAPTHAQATPMLAGMVVGPLALENGEAPAKLTAPANDGATVRFNEGSHIEFAAKAEMDLLVNAPDAVTWLLSQGRVTVDVKPGGPRRWSIECGLATVEVVGTRFTVDRGAGGVMVEVEHGVVLVRGERVPQRVQRLAAGERLTVAAEATASSEAVRHVEREGAPSASAVVREPPAGSRAAQLLDRSDQARAAGRPEEAARLLAALLRDHPGDPHAGEAAFILGKIRLDALRDPARAAQAFEAAIQIGLPKELLEDAYVRLVEARARAGDDVGARAAAIAYDAKFPLGTRRGALARWLLDR